MFYGRKEELEFLNERYSSDKAEFIVLYGRRRVGKTELLRFFSQDKPNIFYVCRECTDREQLHLFSKKMLTNSPMASYISSFNDWENAFSFITNLKGSNKKLILVDEFPYMVNGNTSIPSVLQNLWDEELRHHDVMLVLCGSSMRFIEKEILGEKNPLYGRTTGIYKLLEFDFFSSSNFLKGLNIEEKLVMYSVLGGTAHYLNQYNEQLNLEENIKKKVLSKGAVMYNEVEFLMKQEFRETSTYYTIIEAIALGNTKLNDIYTKTQIDKTKINVYIKSLMELNIIEREYPVTESIKQVVNAQNGLYKIKDNFFKFYFRFMFPNISELEAGDVDGVYNFNIAPQLNEYTSYVFEDVCIQYLRGLNKELALPFRFSKIGRWWDKKNEIDIVAFDNLGSVIYGECKWKNTKVGLAELNRLKEKSVFVDGSFNNKFYFLFSKSGFNDELLKLARIDSSVKLIDLEDIALAIKE